MDRPKIDSMFVHRGPQRDQAPQKSWAESLFFPRGQEGGLFGAGRPVQDWIAQQNAAAQTAYGEALKRTGNSDRAGAAYVHALAGNPADNPIAGGWGPADLAGAGLGLAGVIKAYHGSPHSFDQFSMSKIGTGEGAQAYGHGLYFAENPKVAGDYAKNVIDNDYFDSVNRRLSQIARELDKEAIPGQYGKYRTERGAELKAEYDRLMQERANKNGNLYEVELAPDKADLLDWDKPLSQQPKKIQDAIAAIIARRGGSERYWREKLGDDPDGRRLHAELFTGGDSLSRELLSYGIPGIKYLDQGSRSGSEGTHNFVMFDDSQVKITGRR